MSRLRRAFGFAFEGLRFAWRSQPNFRIELAAAGGAGALALWLGTGLVAVLLASTLVLALELINTAVEATVDLASPERQPLAKQAKDLAAAAVLLASLAAVLVGVAALAPALLERLGLR